MTDLHPPWLLDEPLGHCGTQYWGGLLVGGQGHFLVRPHPAQSQNLKMVMSDAQLELPLLCLVLRNSAQPEHDCLQYAWQMMESDGQQVWGDRFAAEKQVSGAHHCRQCAKQKVLLVAWCLCCAAARLAVT